MSEVGTPYFEQQKLLLGQYDLNPESPNHDVLNLHQEKNSARSAMRKAQPSRPDTYLICYKLINQAYHSVNPHLSQTTQLAANTLELHGHLTNPQIADVMRVFDTWHAPSDEKTVVLRILLAAARQAKGGNLFLALEAHSEGLSEPRTLHNEGEEKSNQGRHERLEPPQDQRAFCAIPAQIPEQLHTLGNFKTIGSLFSESQSVAGRRTPKVDRKQHQMSTASTNPGSSYLEAYLSRSKSRTREGRLLTTERSLQEKLDLPSHQNYTSIWAQANGKHQVDRSNLGTVPVPELPKPEEMLSWKQEGLLEVPKQRLSETDAEIPRSGNEQPIKLDLDQADLRLEFGSAQAAGHFRAQLRRRGLSGLRQHAHWLKVQKHKALVGAAFRRTRLLAKAVYNWHTYLAWGRALLTLLATRRQQLLRPALAGWKHTIGEAKQLRHRAELAEQRHRTNVKAKAWVAWGLFVQRQRAAALFQTKVEQKLKRKYFELFTEEFDSVCEMRRDYGELVKLNQRKVAGKFFGLWWELSHHRLCEKKASLMYHKKTLRKAFGGIRIGHQILKEEEEREVQSAQAAEIYRNNVLVSRSFRLIYANYRVLADHRSTKYAMLLRQMLVGWKAVIKEEKDALPNYTIMQRSLLLRTVASWIGQNPTRLAEVLGFNKNRLVETLQSDAYCTLKQSLESWRAWVTKIKSIRALDLHRYLETLQED